MDMDPRTDRSRTCFLQCREERSSQLSDGQFVARIVEFLGILRYLVISSVSVQYQIMRATVSGWLHKIV